jgi:hypothetical protein
VHIIAGPADSTTAITLKFKLLDRQMECCVVGTAETPLADDSLQVWVLSSKICAPKLDDHGVVCCP